MQCPSPLTVEDPRYDHASRRVTVPCGKCGACLSNRRADWSFRLAEEMKTTINTFFITLTYENKYLKITKDGYPTLDKKDLTNFIKRLRKDNSKLWKNRLRYYCVGEYGPKTGRPHYHGIMYNIHLDLAIPGTGIIDHWDMGNCTVSPVTDARIHYVSKFHVNANKNEIVDEETGEIYERVGEFATMSRKPGIGAGYIERAKKWHQENESTYVINNGFKQRVPRYYKEKIWDPVTRQRLSTESIPEADKRYWREYTRLKKLGIENPDSYMLKSHFEEGKKVTKKNDLSGTF